MAKCKLSALIAALTVTTSASRCSSWPSSFVSPIRRRPAAASASPSRPLSSATRPKKNASTKKSTGSATATPRSPKRTLRDRSPSEFISLVRDITVSAIDAGHNAVPARTLQAYVALTRTLQDYSPTIVSQLLPPHSSSSDRRPSSSRPEPFTYPGALRKLFERLGATYVKLGQFIASSPSLFPEEYVVEFQQCLDSTEALSWKEVEAVLEQELGSPLSRHFSHVERSPLASASIAQVHVATLRSTGEEVVLKVQKPQIGTLLRADLNFLYIATRVLEYLQPDLERTSLSAVAEDVRSSMMDELDFEKEASNIREFRLFLKRNGLEGSATAPRVFSELTTKRVLTMERLRGAPMTDVEAIRTMTEDPESLVATALNTWTSMVMSMPWFHADVHGGNLLVLEDGRVGFIDFGMVGRVGEKTFRAVSELSTSLASGDYEGMATALLHMGATDADVDVKKFGNDIQRVLESIAMVSPDISAVGMGGDGSVRATISFDEGEITNMLLKIVAVTEDNGLRLPREFGLLVKQSLYFDRYLKVLAPGLDVTSDARMLALGGGSNGSASSSTEAEVFA